VDKKCAFLTFQVVETFAPGIRNYRRTGSQQVFEFLNDFKRIASYIVHAWQMFHSEKHSSSRKKGNIFFGRGATVSSITEILSTGNPLRAVINLNHCIFVFVEAAELAQFHGNTGCGKRECLGALPIRDSGL
jgi:hypothetical protein